MESAVDIESLAAWMTDQGLGSGPISNVTPLAGGTQNILLRLTRDGRDYIFRRPPTHPRPNSNETMRREARLLRAIAGTNVPHPALIADCADESVLGVAFYLMEPVNGFNPVGQLPKPHAGSPAMRHAMGLALVDGIAALGALDHQALGLTDFGRPDNFLGRQVDRWRSQLAGYGEFADWTGTQALPSVDAIAAWLERHRPADFTPGIMHGDYHLANVMYRPDSGDLAAIIDWELATIGDPLLDLGWVLATWPDGSGASTVSVTPWEGFPTPAELVARYGAGSARDLSAVDWYHVLACYKLGILLEGTHARACAGKAPRDTGDRLHSRAIHLFDRAQALIR
ncbi:phosphotransferase family protein [Sphingobium yanoikuyae]|uniref:Phosphotransferase family protein n=1 Tax=Sphingobium yanoikuyae TaxID=13690 RepID=A0A085K9K0_SPHYA|nr:phosphotransferase family protein [Sphingobium yanoikuyae]AYO77605.1 phosphotransferase family protein [Sphingobium yanoikuyae]KFD29396.1 aminoglycoside phosphotransferase [Sphingobium yanoikuyae]KZC81768.1 aminoglycoside phosphotransferase [Sphingobium yanoikuyae]MDV3479023.1 phosphotransferase family protein [Sphingobium yanoikuyae]